MQFSRQDLFHPTPPLSHHGSPLETRKHFQFARDVNYHFCEFYQQHLKTYQKSLVSTRCTQQHATDEFKKCVDENFLYVAFRRGVEHIMKGIFTFYMSLFQKAFINKFLAALRVTHLLFFSHSFDPQPLPYHSRVSEKKKGINLTPAHTNNRVKIQNFLFAMPPDSRLEHLFLLNMLFCVHKICVIRKQIYCRAHGCRLENPFSTAFNAMLLLYCLQYDAPSKPNS